MAPADDDFDIYGEDDGFGSVKVEDVSVFTMLPHITCLTRISTKMTSKCPRTTRRLQT